MFALLSPALWRIVGIAVLAAVLFGAGWRANGWRWNEKFTARENALLAEAAKAQQKYAEDMKARQEAADVAVANYELHESQLDDRITQLQKEARNAHFVAPPAPVNGDKGAPATCEHPFTVEFPRAVNGMLDAAEGRDMPAGRRPAASAAGTPENAAGTAALTGDDLAQWAGEVARAYGQCKAQLDAIREWDKK